MVKAKVVRDRSMVIMTTANHLANYLRRERGRTCLTQREVGVLLGYSNNAEVSRHERSQLLPTLAVALAYEVIFGVSASEIFVGIKESVEVPIVQRLVELQSNLHGSSQKRLDATTERKLDWLSHRLADSHIRE